MSARTDARCMAVARRGSYRPIHPVDSATETGAYVAYRAEHSPLPESRHFANG